MAVDPSSSEEQRIVAEYHICHGEVHGRRWRTYPAPGNHDCEEDYIKLLNIVEDARKECERVHNSLVRASRRERG